MNPFANLLARIAGQPIEDLFKWRIADPIRMNPAKLNWRDFGSVHGIVVNAGCGNSNNHIFISARQLARFGHLLLTRGKWKGKQLISASCLDVATRVQVPPTMPLGYPESGTDGRAVYGCDWWTNGFKNRAQILTPNLDQSSETRARRERRISSR